MRRAEDASWGLPGGGVEPGESWSEAAVRECREETGWLIRVTGLFGAYSDPRSQVHVYPDGRAFHFFGVVFTAEVAQEVGSPDDEVMAVGLSSQKTYQRLCSHRTCRSWRTSCRSGLPR